MRSFLSRFWYLLLAGFLFQQKVLQQRYVTTLLQLNTQSPKLPTFLLSSIGFDSHDYQAPLLFATVRKPTHLKGLHALASVLRTIDSYTSLDSLENIGLNWSTCLELPFSSLCLANSEIPSILENDTFCSKKKKASYFFKLSTTIGRLVFQRST